MTLAKFDYDSSTPFIDITEGYHPLLVMNMDRATDFGDSRPSVYNPSDTVLGRAKGVVMLMTGPDRGGKNTLMIRVAILIVLTHLGTIVPAKSMKLTTVDRILYKNGSATKHSLVIIDKLGRGTSTAAVLSIAAATLEYCPSHVGCRTIFATHFKSLCTAFKDHKDVLLAHMACRSK